MQFVVLRDNVSILKQYVVRTYIRDNCTINCNENCDNTCIARRSQEVWRSVTKIQLKIDTCLLQMPAEHSGHCFLLEASWY